MLYMPGDKREELRAISKFDINLLNINNPDDIG